MNGLICVNGEACLMDVTLHAATRDVSATLPCVKGHEAEWVHACGGEGRTFSDFDTGGLLTEIGLAGVVALRTGRSLDWDGAQMRATNAPEAVRFVRREYPEHQRHEKDGVAPRRARLLTFSPK